MSSINDVTGMPTSVKNIKICHPQEPSSARASKSDTLVSNKVFISPFQLNSTLSAPPEDLYVSQSSYHLRLIV